jgi:hypothetical protein
MCVMWLNELSNSLSGRSETLGPKNMASEQNEKRRIKQIFEQVR